MIRVRICNLDCKSFVGHTFSHLLVIFGRNFAGLVIEGVQGLQRFKKFVASLRNRYITHVVKVYKRVEPNQTFLL